MTRKAQQAPAATGRWGKIGNKTTGRTWLAVIPDNIDAAPGMVVTLVSSYGGETTVTLDQRYDTKDGDQRWTIKRERVDPDQYAKNLALRAARNADYWASDEGKATAQRRAERLAARQTQQAQQDETPAQTAPDQTTHTPGTIPLADVQALIAQAVATALASVQVAGEAPTIDQAHQMVKAATTKTATTKAATTKTATTKAATIREECDACGKRDQLHKARGVGAMVCATCATCDTDTLKMRVARRDAKLSQ